MPPFYNPKNIFLQSKGVYTIIGVNCFLFLLELLPAFGLTVVSYGQLIPSRVFMHGEVWRLLTYAFLHDAILLWHLVFNMLALWMFGRELEERMGTGRFVIVYCLMAIVSGLFSTLAYNTPVIGASGAILALLTIYAFWYPDRQILMFFIFPMPVKIAVLIIGIISVYGSIGGSSGLAHLCHLGGIVAGFAYFKFSEPLSNYYRAYVMKQKEEDKKIRAKDFLSRERHYTEVIDPILKKISERGMQSLTRQEKKELEIIAKTDASRLKKSTILPFDILKKKK